MRLSSNEERMFHDGDNSSEKTGKTGWIRFHRPEVRNAVNQKMMEELESVWNEWEKDEQLQAVVFYGDEKAFLSGGDVGNFTK